MSNCGVCERDAYDARGTIYGTLVCKFCHSYLCSSGSNAHGRQVFPRWMSYGTQLIRAISARRSAIDAAIVSGTPILHEYFLYDYPPDWEERKSLVFRRDKFTCKVCGTKDRAQLLVHHENPVEKGGLHFLDNLRTLCRPCHDREYPGLVERKIREQRKTRRAICPNHQLPMERLPILWGEIAQPVPGVLYGGCVIRVDPPPKFGFVCSGCKDGAGPNFWYWHKNILNPSNTLWEIVEEAEGTG